MQKPLELLEQGRIGPLERLVQGHHNPLQQSVLSARRVRNHAYGEMIVELSQKIADKCRFPATDFAGDYGKAGAIHYAKLKHGECQSVILAPVDQIRIRQNRERFLSESVKCLIHRKTLNVAIRLRNIKNRRRPS